MSGIVEIVRILKERIELNMNTIWYHKNKSDKFSSSVLEIRPIVLNLAYTVFFPLWVISFKVERSYQNTFLSETLIYFLCDNQTSDW